MLKPHHLLPCLRDRWKSLHIHHRHFVGNMVVGLLIVIVLHSFHNFPVLTQFENVGIDWMIQQYSGTAPEKPTVPFVWLDIDEVTYKAWREPLYTPRDKLLELIRFAAESEAKVVIIDIDLSQADKPAEGDDKLKAYLQAYINNCQNQVANNNVHTCVPIILIRTFQPIPQGDYLLQRAAILDEIVTETTPYVYWASPLYEASADGVFRYWRLWEPTCTATQTGIVVPSIQLLTATLLQTSNPQVAVNQLKTELASFAPKDCANDSRIERETDNHGKIFQLGDLELHLTPNRINRRIFYALPWQPYDKRIKDMYLLPNYYMPLVTTPENQQVPFLATLSAQHVSRYQNQLLKDRIVIIGASYLDSRDIYMTPLRSMPGSLIIINAVHSLLQQGEIEHIPWWIKIFIAAILIFIMSIFFTLFDSYWAKIFSGFIILLLWLPFSLTLFYYHGLWLDFMLPLVAVHLLQIWAEYKEGYRNAKEEEI